MSKPLVLVNLVCHIQKHLKNTIRWEKRVLFRNGTPFIPKKAEMHITVRNAALCAPTFTICVIYHVIGGEGARTCKTNIKININLSTIQIETILHSLRNLCKKKLTVCPCVSTPLRPDAIPFSVRKLALSILALDIRACFGRRDLGPLFKRWWTMVPIEYKNYIHKSHILVYCTCESIFSIHKGFRHKFIGRNSGFREQFCDFFLLSFCK